MGPGLVAAIEQPSRYTTRDRDPRRCRHHSIGSPAAVIRVPLDLFENVVARTPREDRSAERRGSQSAKVRKVSLPSRKRADAEDRNTSPRQEGQRAMTQLNRRIVQHRDDGGWEVRAPGASRASATARNPGGSNSSCRRFSAGTAAENSKCAHSKARFRRRTRLPPQNDPRSSRLGSFGVSRCAGVHEIAERTGTSANTLRPRLRVLVEEGALIATAPAQSRNRRYRIGDRA